MGGIENRIECSELSNINFYRFLFHSHFMNHLYKRYLLFSMFKNWKISNGTWKRIQNYQIYRIRFLFHSPFYENVPVDCLYKHYLFLQEYISRIWKRTDER